MIIWLSSYPRSGNTLTRTVLKKCFNIDTYSDDPIGKTLSCESSAIIGHKEYSGDWPNFYKHARASREIFFIKTHNKPLDDSPFIYIARDGRAAAWSYYNFMKDFFPETKRSLVQIIVGDDYYGDWSSHYASWMNRAHVRCLRLDFDKLIDPTSETIQQLTDFIGYYGAIQPWKNPMYELHQKDPRFFREGLSTWTAPEDWTVSIDFLFWDRHGSLMQTLGLRSKTHPSVQSEYQRTLSELNRLAARWMEKNEMLQRVCSDRQIVIDELHSECEKRLAMINEFHVSNSLS